MAHAGMAVSARGTDAWGWPLAQDGGGQASWDLCASQGGRSRTIDGVGEWPLAHDHVWHGEGGRLRTTLYQGPVAMMLRLDLEGGRLRTIGAGLGVAVCARWRHVCRV